MKNRLLSLREAQAAAGGLSQATIYRRVAADDFPQPIVLSRTKSGRPARIAFVESEVSAWCRRMIDASRDFTRAKADAVFDRLVAERVSLAEASAREGPKDPASPPASQRTEDAFPSEQSRAEQRQSKGRVSVRQHRVSKASA